MVTVTKYKIQAEITGSRDREHAWSIITNAPPEWREDLTRHAQTVFAIRKFHARPKKTGR